MHQHFTSRRGFTGNRSYEFSRQLVERGHRVTMLCSGIENEPRLTVPKGKSYIETEVDGIHCVPIAAALANPLQITGQSGHRRMLGFLNFVRLAKRVGRCLPPPDIVFCSHTPLTIGLAGMDLSRHFHVPFVFEVRDLWPQALINLGVLRNRLVIHWMRRMERRIYRAADHIVALSPGMKEGIVSTGVDESRVTVIPNACDLDLFRPDLPRKPGRDRLGIGDRFAAIYFGGMGYANGLEYVIEAARILQQRGREDIVIVLHGGGGQRGSYLRLVEEYKLDNVIFSDPVPDKAKVAELVAGCDVCLTIYRATIEQSWSPNKMFDALAAGRPVLINVAGWLGDTIERNGCGKSLDPGQPAELADALVKLSQEPAAVAEMGRRARALAEGEFARKIGIESRACPCLRPAEVWSKLNFLVKVPKRGMYHPYGKRLFDLGIATCAGIAVLPFVGLLALAVRWRLGSPVFFRQTRAGRNGRPFEVVKFRSMTDARDPRGRLLPDDERMTAFGRFLRGSSLDELPQLWNVIRGDMSLVGPRPLLLDYVDRYSPAQKVRLAATPGITGWVQIHGRNAISWEERFAYDIWYVEHLSFLLDLWILLKTALRLLMPANVSADNHATMPEFLGTGNDAQNP